jgi:hypothetical protein
MTDDYCCLACADGEWNSNANPRLPPSDIGSIILHSPKKCLADYIKRIQHQRDDARYEAHQERQLRLQAESCVDKWKDYHRNLAENFKLLVDEELDRFPTYYQRERLRDWLIHAEAMIELTGGWD